MTKLIWRGIATAGLAVFTLFGWGEAAVPAASTGDLRSGGDLRYDSTPRTDESASPVRLAQWWGRRYRPCNCNAVAGVRG